MLSSLLTTLLALSAVSSLSGVSAAAGCPDAQTGSAHVDTTRKYAHKFGNDHGSHRHHDFAHKHAAHVVVASEKKKTSAPVVKAVVATQSTIKRGRRVKTRTQPAPQKTTKPAAALTTQPATKPTTEAPPVVKTTPKPAATTAPSPSSGNALQDAALASHNSARAKYGASALTWSSQLQASAQAWADKCYWGHGGGQALGAGENLALFSSKSGTVTDSVNMWMAEAKDYNPSAPNYSHFTQVVWKETSQLGCALAYCPTIANNDFGGNFIVCHYLKPGNVYPASNFLKNVGALKA